jgi:hypothetical protein
MPVAQPVADQGEQFAGGGDLADVGAAVFADASTELPDRAVVLGLHGLDRGPADQGAARSGDPAAVALTGADAVPPIRRVATELRGTSRRRYLSASATACGRAHGPALASQLNAPGVAAGDDS